MFALGLCVLATPLLAMGAPTSAEDTPTENDTITGVKRVADPETSAAWKDALSISADELAYSTADAGQVWVDASVYADTDAAQKAGIAEDALTSVDKDNFLASISAIASVAAIHEQDSTPNDVVFVVSLNSILDSAMKYAGLPYASYLVSALNNAIGHLMDSNTGNGSSPTRVAVVGYNYNVTVLMPLDTYTPNADGKYLTYDSGKISVTATGSEGTITNDANLGSGSYLQKAISVAGNQLETANGTSGRTPVMVVMSVENPPTANTAITNPPDYVAGQNGFLGPQQREGGYGTDAIFATLLTMRYVHQQVDATYGANSSGNTLTLYTTGIDTTDAVAYLLETPEGQNDFPLSAMVNGAEVDLTKNLNEAAKSYAEAARNSKEEVTLELYGSGSGGNLQDEEITFPVEPDLLDQDNPSSLSCVDHYFAAHSAAAIDWAYTSAIDDTLAVHYISPVDTEDALNGGTRVEATSEIGPGMDVASITGIQYGDEMLTGSLAAHAIVMSFTGSGDFYDDLNATHELDYIIRSINNRYNLGMDAYNLLYAAIANGQITYDGAGKYSNRAAWYVNSSGKMVNGDNNYPFRLAGQDEINAAVNGTEGTDEATRTKLDAAKSAGATSICETYFYIGNLPNFYTGGDIALYDFYISVTTSLNDGTQTVSASIPSDAIPALRVDVTTHGGNNATAALDDVDSLNPIRLVFEVAPRQNVKEVADEVSAAIAAGTAPSRTQVETELGSAAITGASGKLIVPALAVNADGTTVQAQTVVEGTAAPAGSVYMVEKDTPLYALSPSASVEEGAMPAPSDLQPLKTPPTPGETYYYLVDTYEAVFSNPEGIVEATPSKAVRAYVATSDDSGAWNSNGEGVYELAAGTSTLPLGQEVTLVTKTENPTDTAPYVRTLSGTMGNNELTLSARLGNNGAIVFETPEPEPEPEPEPDPEPGGDEGGTTDPDNPGGTTDPDNPDTSTDPDNPDDPGTSTDPDSPDNPGDTPGTNPDSPDEPDNPGDEPGTDPDNPGDTPGSDSDAPETPGETPGSTPSPDRPSDTDHANTNNNTLANTADMSGSGLVAPLLVIGITILAAGIGLAIRRK